MKKLKAKDYIKFGKRNAIFSMCDDQPCADHDRSEGEGLGPQEYTLIKLQLIEGGKIPEKVGELMKQGKKIFCVAATLRPETMYGQTNCYILPKGEYGLYEMNNGEIYVSSIHAMLNMAYQEKTKEPKKEIDILEAFLVSEIILKDTFNIIKSSSDENILSIDKIKTAVSEYYSISVSQLESKTRTSNISVARHIAMYMCYKYLNVSLNQIGEAFGGKDHTSVGYAIEKVENMCKENPDYLASIQDLKKLLKIQ